MARESLARGTAPTHACSLTCTQLPLLAASAITVHKAQGMSLAFFQAIFGDKELALGCTYVQLSRATALSGIVLKDPMTLKRLIGLSQSDRADQRCAFDLKCDAPRGRAGSGRDLYEKSARSVAARKTQVPAQAYLACPAVELHNAASLENPSRNN